jgi:hypothetical protein
VNKKGRWRSITFPNHIHIEGRVEAVEPPDLSEVLHKIDELLCPTGQQDSTLNNQAEERVL